MMVDGVEARYVAAVNLRRESHGFGLVRWWFDCV
jgi:hypothetical protein